MTTGHVFIAASLDGFIARSDDQLDWLEKQNTAGEDHGYKAFIASVDGLIMGRGSFLKVLTFPEWPYEKPVIVMSRSLNADDIPEELSGRVRITPLSPPELMQSLNDAGWQRAYVDGGKIITSFLAAGLISDIILTHIPILIGEGIRLFSAVPHDIDLQHIETRPFPSGLVRSRYNVLNTQQVSVE